MSNYYKEAIDRLFCEHDWKSVAIEFAKRHPKEFVDYCKSMGWENEAKSLVNAGKKIDAIKMYRNMTGMSLKEAKEAVERL